MTFATMTTFIFPNNVFRDHFFIAVLGEDANGHVLVVHETDLECLFTPPKKRKLGEKLKAGQAFPAYQEICQALLKGASLESLPEAS